MEGLKAGERMRMRGRHETERGTMVEGNTGGPNGVRSTRSRDIAASFRDQKPAARDKSGV